MGSPVPDIRTQPGAPPPTTPSNHTGQDGPLVVPETPTKSDTSISDLLYQMELLSLGDTDTRPESKLDIKREVYVTPTPVARRRNSREKDRESEGFILVLVPTGALGDNKDGDVDGDSDSDRPPIDVKEDETPIHFSKMFPDSELHVKGKDSVEGQGDPFLTATDLIPV